MAVNLDLHYSDHIGNWMPLFHDMGLIGYHLTPLYSIAHQFHIETMDFKSGVIDTDGALTANSDLKLATQKATKTYVDGKTTGRTKKYVGTITAVATQTIAAATYGCTADVVVAVYETISTTRYSVEVDINVNAAGDVTWTSATAITGQIVIIG